MLNTENSDKLNGIRYSPYIADDLLLQSRKNRKHCLRIVSLNCQSLHAKFDCPLQAICLQENWFSPETDLSLYIIPGYHIISTGRYASNHGGLVIYLIKKWEYKIKTDVTESKLWERQIIEILTITKLKEINLLMVTSTGHHIIHLIVLILL